VIKTRDHGILFALVLIDEEVVNGFPEDTVLRPWKGTEDVTGARTVFYTKPALRPAVASNNSTSDQGGVVVDARPELVVDRV
jgi:hypothetical protein